MSMKMKSEEKQGTGMGQKLQGEQGPIGECVMQILIFSKHNYIMKKNSFTHYADFIFRDMFLPY